MKANKILPSLSLSKVWDKLAKHDENLNGFSFYNNPSVIHLVADGSAYTDENGNYVLADSETGKSLLADAEVYTSNTVEGRFSRIEGADSVLPFSGGGFNYSESETIGTFGCTTGVEYSYTATEDGTYLVIAATYTERPTTYGHIYISKMTSDGEILLSDTSDDTSDDNGRMYNFMITKMSAGQSLYVNQANSVASRNGNNAYWSPCVKIYKLS